VGKTTMFAIVGLLGLAAGAFYFLTSESGDTENLTHQENPLALEVNGNDSHERSTAEELESSGSGDSNITEASVPVAASPGSIATPYPSEFQRILENRRPGYRYESIADLHKKFAHQDRDPDWANEAEDKFRNHFAESSQIIPYGQPTVECKTSMCEVRLSTDRAGPDTDWQRIVTPPRPDPQSDSYSISGFGMATDELDGKNSVVLIVTYDRSRPPP
jgi:hypothetical protein